MSALWHPFSSPEQQPSFKLSRGNGVYVYDDQGREYINGSGGLWNITVGLGNKTIIDSMQAQLQQLAYGNLFDASHQPAEKLAETLLSLTNGNMHKVYLSTTGSSAVEVAIRAARAHFHARGKKHKYDVVSFDKSYHGCSLINLSASGLEQGDLNKWECGLPGFYHVQSPEDEKGSLEQIRMLMQSHSEEISCLLMEPILGSGGIIVPSREYGEAVNRICLEYDVLLIADEVATAGGRCGSMFASDLVGLKPDIITMSKALNSGYAALGATLFNKKVCTPISQAHMPLLYGSTQDGNPTACTAALATLKYIQENNLTERARQLGEYFHSSATAPNR